MRYESAELNPFLSGPSYEVVLPMVLLILKAYVKLIQFDFYLAWSDFAALHDRVRRCPVAKHAEAWEIARVCWAVDTACIWHWKEVLCLQRSAATACLLKNCGIAAQMTIGAQHMPFKAHAWVEVEGRVVNDKPYMREIYAVLDHC